MVQTLALDPQEDSSQLRPFTYTACYCEENVYLLCKSLLEAQNGRHLQPAALCVVFISNDARKVPLWRQRASRGPDDTGFVCWDYHVLLLEQQTTGTTCVWDLDSTLDLPCSASQYIQEALRPELQLPADFKRCYRVVPAALFLDGFASDRSHMRLPDGGWLATPPPYPCIRSAGGAAMTLTNYLDMRLPDAIDDLQGGSQARQPMYGRVLQEPQFLSMLQAPSSFYIGLGQLQAC